MLKNIANFLIKNENKNLFMKLYSKYKHDPVFAKFHNFYISRKPYCKTESCPICFEDECEIIPYDCFCHGYCITCTIKIDKCCICKINKNYDFKYLF